jgi:cell wall-associated NlpC family hydrolase
MIVFEEFGISLPHNAQGQSKYGTLIKSRDNLRKGDIVFFHGSYKTSNYITHSGIYAGDNKFIHTSSGKGVTITSMDDSWWKGKFAFGSRIIK